MRKIAAGLALFAALVTTWQCAAPAAAAVTDLNTVKEGDAIPAFKGRTLTGEEVDVGALLGKKVVVLAFWSIYCKPCVEEISSLIRLQEQLGGKDLAVIGVNADAELGLARIRSFTSRFEEFEKRRINYPVVFDEDSKISKLLGVGFLPTVLSVNLKGQVERIFMGFEGKSEAEIFSGIRKLLPIEGAAEDENADATVFPVDVTVPLCGFYDSAGWKANFERNFDLPRELERVSEIARRAALKAALRQALVAVGVTLLQAPEQQGCFTSYGVRLIDDPFRTPDCLTNLLNALPAERLAKVLDSDEDFLDTEYRVSARIAVNLADLKGELEKVKVQVTPHTVTFSVVNLRAVDLDRFQKALVRQSRYIGFANFPTYSIYTTTETFADEVKRMDLGRLRLFIEEAEGDKIEVEAWK